MRKGPLSDEVLEFFRKHGADGGKKGGKRSLETMTAEERSARAKKASKKAAEVRAQNAVAKKAAAKSAEMRTKKAAAKKKATAKKS